MKTIKITRECRDKIREFGLESESVDDTIKRLLSMSKLPKMDLKKYDNTNIRVSHDTYERLMNFKTQYHMTHSHTIIRLLSEIENEKNEGDK